VFGGSERHVEVGPDEDAVARKREQIFEHRQRC
jgi:hypothetical protein